MKRAVRLLTKWQNSSFFRKEAIMKSGSNTVILILAFGVFSIINTEMGIIGILPLIADVYNVDISAAGLLVSLFALAVAVSGPILPLIMSRFNRKYVLSAVLAVFFLCNLVAAFVENFEVLLIVRVLPAFLHPVYVSLAFSAASASVSPKDMPKAAAKVMAGVSAGMVLGVPVMSWTAEVFSLQIAILLFAAVNAAALLAVILGIPSMPKTDKMSYDSQLRVLKDTNVLISFSVVVCLNGGIFGVFSYMADYLQSTVHLVPQIVSAVLLVYGIANIAGNLLAGRILTWQPLKLIYIFPIAVSALYIAMYYSSFAVWLTVFLVLVWGVLSGINGNINQYLMTKAAPNVTEFANALFLVAANVGTSIGVFICGAVITHMGVSWILFGGIAFFAASIILIWCRYHHIEQIADGGKIVF